MDDTIGGSCAFTKDVLHLTPNTAQAESVTSSDTFAGMTCPSSIDSYNKPFIFHHDNVSIPMDLAKDDAQPCSLPASTLAKIICSTIVTDLEQISILPDIMTAPYLPEELYVQLHLYPNSFS